MPLGVFHNRGRRVKTHGLIVQQTGVKLRGSMRFQIRASVGQNGEADGVGLWKSVESKRGDRLDDFVDHWRTDTLPSYGRAKFDAHLIHPLLGSMKTQRAPQLFGFVA